MKRHLYLVVLVALLFVTPTFAQDANLTAGCVENYDPDVDYFPGKISIDHAQGLEVEYFNHYKVVTVTQPWVGATEADAFVYLLVQCGTPVPEGYPDVALIEIPAGDLIAMSTTYLPPLVEMGLVDHLIGLDSFLYVNTAEIVEKIETGDLIEVGYGPAVNVEMILDADPSLVMVGSGSSREWDAHPVLLEAGVFIAMNGDWIEQSPLGRAEWLKFPALFYSTEAEANALYGEVTDGYESLATLVADMPDSEKPVVLWNSYSSWSEAWDIPGSDSYSRQLLQDAGATVVMGDDPQVQGLSGIVPFDFEIVYEAGLEADVWFPSAFMWYGLSDALAADERYVDFAAFQNNAVYNNNARENANGGNEYYETGATNPHVLLADLIYILHPEQLPDHELVYFRKLAPLDE
jgi:iron complex transport system substrate-binding protein